MRTTVQYLILLQAMALVLSGCVRFHVAPNTSSIDEAKARVLSDGLVSDLIQDRKTEVYQKMEKAFREITSQKDFELTLKDLLTTYGKPLSAEYTHNVVSAKTYFDGQMRPLRRFYYAVTTSKYEKGEFYLTVEVVPDQADLGVTGVYFRKLESSG